MNNKTELLEIYKVHVELSERVSERRGQTNKFYIALLTGILTILSFTTSDNTIIHLISPRFILLVIGLTGVLLCLLWFFNIKSYRQLNSGKFKTLHEIEGSLEFPFFQREWELLDQGKKAKTYFQLSRIEQYTPLILLLPYVMVLCYAILSF